ncbi:sugar transferase [Sphingomonas aurea]|uniref:sugar transferase n=1 Tax=Sphingomonas aurea TaxID=3063994 RepID=UPI002730B19F|nr:sugar transferase [Sphingomonas sp. KR1UV-12]
MIDVGTLCGVIARLEFVARIQQLRPNFWMRLRFQLPIAILLAALFPYLIRYQFNYSTYDLYVSNNTLIGVILATMLGAWLMRNISGYPGAEAIASTLPAFSVSFAILLLIFIFARIPYNRTILFLGFAFSVFWFFVMSAAALRRRILRIGLVPQGDYAAILNLPNVSITLLHAPDTSIDELDAVAVDLRIDLSDEWDRRLADFALARMPVYHTKHLVESLTGRVELEHLSENSFGSLAPRHDYMMLKAVLDWVLALIVGVLTSPVMIIVAVIIRINSRGPALFRQQRMGYEGRPFTIYKFRTMHIVNDESDERCAAMTKDSDCRITSVGRFLRTSRLDELPQIANVLKGEMSWIGPRPEAMVLSRWYEKQIPFYRYRHVVRPGIAGWAQVCQGHVSEVDDVRSKLHYDFYYIKQYSPWIDLLIVLQTIRVILTGHGAR